MASTPVVLFTLQHSGRVLIERGIDLEQSTRDIVVDEETAALIAEVVGLPADFCMAVFGGEPVKRAEQIAHWSLRETGFRRVQMLAAFAAKAGRVVPAGVIRGACETTVADHGYLVPAHLRKWMTRRG